MTMTVGQIEDLLGKTPGSGTSKGAARFHGRRRPGQVLPQGQRALVDALSAQEGGPSVTVKHPASEAGVHQRPDGADLTQAELMWLDRLPRDPAQVSFEDASRLIAMRNSLSATSAPHSTMLLDSILEPVVLLHDLRVAEARLSAAKAVTTSVPGAAVEALREAVEAENPGLSESGARAEARALLDALETRLHADRERIVSRLEAEVVRIKERTAQRSETAREVTAR